MVDFSQTEIINELSQVFRGSVDPSRQSSIVDAKDLHAQILEIAALIFLTDKNAVYYLAAIVRNTLSFLVLQEVSILEDMLVAIQSLQDGQQRSSSAIGRVGPVDLANANAHLLSLDAASSVQGRPELTRFSRAIDHFAELMRPGLTKGNGGFLLPKEEARSILRQDILLLKEMHPRVLAVMESLQNLLVDYAAADVPTRVSKDAISHVRTLLLEMSRFTTSASSAESLASNRLLLLRSLVLKVAVGLLKNFQNPDPTLPKLSSSGAGTAAAGIVGGSPNSAPSGTFTLQATGEGTAASVISLPGPWLLDTLSVSHLRVKIDDGAVQSFDLSLIQGPAIVGRNKAPYITSQFIPIWPGIPASPDDPLPPPKEDFARKNNLHIIVDPTVYALEATEWLPGTPTKYVLAYGVGAPPVDDVQERPLYNRVKMQPPIKLGFKHLGTPVHVSVDGSFSKWRIDGETQAEDIGEWGSPGDTGWPNIFVPRVITELALLASGGTLTHLGGNRYASNAGFFKEWYVGFYVKSAPDGRRFEIIGVSSAYEATIDTRGDIGAAAGSYAIYGETNSETEITFSPDMLAGTNGDLNVPERIPQHAFVSIGPAVKTAHVPVGSYSISDLVALFSDPDGSTHSEALRQFYSHPAYFVRFRESFAKSGRLVIENRSRLEPEKLAIADKFLNARTDTQEKVDKDPPYLPVQIGASAHEVLGFDVGQQVDDKLDVYLDLTELAALITDTMDVGTTEVVVVETDILSAGTLSVIAGTKTFTDAEVDFDALELGFGYFIEVQDGDNKGTYIIESQAAGVLTVQTKVAFVGAEEGLAYRIFIQQLQISSKNKGRGSSVQITEAPSQFGFPTSIAYGVLNQVEAVNAAGDVLNLAGLGKEDKANAVCIQSVAADGSSATTCDPVSSALVGQVFDFFGGTEAAFQAMSSRLSSLLNSRSLFKKRNFDVSVDAVDTAIASLVTPGLNSQSNTNQARTVVADLLSLLTTTHLRGDEYLSTTVPVASLDVMGAISAYDAARTRQVDDLLDTLLDYKYDRAASLLVTGRIKDFFDTDSENASFSGALLQASRIVVADLPLPQQTLSNVDADVNTAAFVRETTDADESKDGL